MTRNGLDREKGFWSLVQFLFWENDEANNFNRLEAKIMLDRGAPYGTLWAWIFPTADFLIW